MTTAAQKRSLAAHRRRMAESGTVRVEVRVPAADAALIKKVATAVKDNPAVRSALELAIAPTTPTEQNAPSEVSGTRFRTLAELFESLPDISGPEFDEAFDIPRDHAPIRDVEF